jgi:hypothetical protein
MRKPIQIHTQYYNAENLFITTALCDDGTMWQKTYYSKGWTQLPSIPQPKETVPNVPKPAGPLNETFGGK